MGNVGLRSFVVNPSLTGLCIIVLYLIGFLVCLRATVIVRIRMAYSSPSYEYPLFWLLTAWCMLLLGLSRELNIHLWLTHSIRMLAREEGWYLERRPFQIGVLIAVCVTSMGFLGFVSWYLRATRWPYLLAFFGIVFVIGFSVVRLVSFHDLDVFLAQKYGGITLNRIVEIGAILCVILAGWWAPPVRVAQHKNA